MEVVVVVVVAEVVVVVAVEVLLSRSDTCSMVTADNGILM